MKDIHIVIVIILQVFLMIDPCYSINPIQLDSVLIVNADNKKLSSDSLNVFKEVGVAYNRNDYPEFPGGDEKMFDFIRNKMILPSSYSDFENRIVIVRFMVKPNGRIEDVKILRGLDSACDNEALRIMSLMPRWAPATRNGKKVKAQTTIPIIFRLKE